MPTMTSAQVRESFIKFFESKDHLFVRSSPVVPHDDPTLMFTNAGMNQFKAIFLGDNPKGWKRACNSQKCLRVSGKHNDLDVVGRDNYHHTFFEMLGNWSFGDYYKKEAISWAWELLTEVWKLPKERLFATVYQDDDEAWQIWKDVSGLPDDRIMRFDAHSNFWEMGDTGPCGPCSEIHYDRGDLATQMETFKDPILGVNGENDRYIEIWNNVFMQYERISDGSLIPLKAKNVDTGMGFERICAILQGKRSNYDTDVFTPIISKVAELSGVPYTDDENGTPHRVIADHIRAVSFAIADGALPSNEGRGYVLRRILRRASRFARLLGQKEAFIYKLVQVLADTMGEAFPEIRQRQAFVTEVIKSEEDRFIKTLDAGLERFEAIVTEMGSAKVVPGDKVFVLYDTYGFPPDLTGILAEEKGLTIDEAGFEKCMEEQKERARANMKQGINTMGTEGWTQYSEASTNFVGYELSACETKVVRYREDKGVLSIVLETSPFYAEMGGQVGDKGMLVSADLELSVFDTVKVNDTALCRAKVVKGEANEQTMGGVFMATVDNERRMDIRRNHSATHLLQAALREVLGSHVQQQGSLVTPDSLRFDFTHFNAMTAEEIQKVEDIVNAKVMECLPVNTDVMGVDEAKASGAMALFGEKYGDTVRVVKMGAAGEEFSKELCGGLHVSNSGNIGMVKIISESSVSAGVRRIEAVTGRGAMSMLRAGAQIVNALRDRLRCKDAEVLDRIQQSFEKTQSLEKALQSVKLELATMIAGDVLNGGLDVMGVMLYVREFDMPEDKYKELLDGIQNKLDKGAVAVIANKVNGAGSIAVIVGKDVQAKGIKAGDMVRDLAAACNGKGGGRPDRAQAGTREPEKISAAIKDANNWIRAKLG
ncbi:alanyl-tRNA synthetase [Fibrobacter sp. UWH9]|uniref:alanine--tRNA ligase n=1 Tax=unclassified Fibrobacter TaxID=2634177 RepID=UPI00090FB547|nr:MULTISPECIES: alanine--tRNA ligase [Fibrobacter]MCL4102595.1 Alanine--tRNA ligase [Fibrobacter succinogenes]OWV10384.1 alanine--tRNA ligase [Fibrobacter sp. UWH1]SHH87152.1 alanyl-tRNA synthetase [Fibrobacter sp. UWH9]SHK70678.1 alanyl-tRNA synthetase [Fibrobacter sp. UWH5]